jgi:hypothetical protein
VIDFRLQFDSAIRIAATVGEVKGSKLLVEISCGVVVDEIVKVLDAGFLHVLGESIADIINGREFHFLLYI